MAEMTGRPTPERPLAGKVALVTGAGQGAGRGVAEAFVAAGASVALVGRTLAKLEAVTAALPVGTTLPIACDVGEPDQLAACVERTVAELGGVQILVNAAHHTIRGGTLLEVTDDDIEALWRTGPLASLRLMRLCHPHLAGDGVVINFGSGAQFTPQGYGAYAATKDAISALTRAAAVEWGGDGIRCHVIVPHVVSPSMVDDLTRQGRLGSIVQKIPVGRLGQPTDIGNAALFLADPASSFITGQTLMVDGGMIYHR
jgi:meso-butanediol dehydrogenase/(S,S)-butanediol dehydrogenase/diacetyl reductase